jgi:hypothetical protein
MGQPSQPEAVGWGGFRFVSIVFSLHFLKIVARKVK